MSGLTVEIAAMRAIDKQMAKLETPEAKGRVLNYINSTVGEELQRLARERHAQERAAVNLYEKQLEEKGAVIHSVS